MMDSMTANFLSFSLIRLLAKNDLNPSFSSQKLAYVMFDNIQGRVADLIDP